MEQIESTCFRLGFPSPVCNTVHSDFPCYHYIKHGTAVFIKQLLIVKLEVVQLVKEIPSLLRREFFIWEEVGAGSEAI